MVVDLGCVCCAFWWQCGVRNCCAWFVLVNVGFVEQSAFSTSIDLEPTAAAAARTTGLQQLSRASCVAPLSSALTSSVPSCRWYFLLHFQYTPSTLFHPEAPLRSSS